MARGRPALWSTVLALPFIGAGVWTYLNQGEVPSLIGLPFATFGIIIVTIGVYVHLVDPETPQLPDDDTILEEGYPPQRMPALKIAAGGGLLGATGYLLVATSLPYLYPTVTFGAGLFLFSTGLVGYWSNALTTYYVTTDRVIKEYRFPPATSREISVDELQDDQADPSASELLTAAVGRHRKTGAADERQTTGPDREPPVDQHPEAPTSSIDSVRRRIEQAVITAEAYLERGEYDAVERVLEKAEERISDASERSDIDEEHSAYLSTLQSELRAIDDRREILQAIVDEIEATNAALDAGDITTAHERGADLQGHLAEYPQSDAAIETLEARVAELEEQIRTAAEAQVAEALDEAETLAADGEDLLTTGEHNAARQRAQDGLERWQDATNLADELEVKLDENASKVAADLETIIDQVDAAADAQSNAETACETARRAAKAREYDRAREAIDDAEAAISTLAEYPGTDEQVATLQADLTDIKTTVDAGEAATRVNGLLGSAESMRKQAAALVDDGEYARAVTRLESALESLDEAATMNDQHDLERAERIATTRRDIEDLLEDARTGPTAELREVLEEGEAAVAQGIDDREAGDLQMALDAFQEAQACYERALALAEQHEVAERWEVEQRHSMVNEYVSTVEAALSERQREVRSNLERHLEEAADALTRAKQHEEVADTVSARETLGSAVIELDEATQLIESGHAATALVSRYERLVDEVETLHERLPDEAETAGYSTRELVESLQQLATQLGESPSPEFVTEYGDYPAEAYLETYGSWAEALAAANLDPIDEARRERRKYSRVEVLDAVREVAAELGRPPTQSEMTELGEISASPVMNRFRSWETAMELAGVPDDTKTDADSPESETTDHGSAQDDAAERDTTDDTEQDEDAPPQLDLLEQIEAEMRGPASSED